MKKTSKEIQINVIDQIQEGDEGLDSVEEDASRIIFFLFFQNRTKRSCLDSCMA